MIISGGKFCGNGFGGADSSDGNAGIDLVLNRLALKGAV
jgi:hypothetical protein